MPESHNEGIREAPAVNSSNPDRQALVRMTQATMRVLDAWGLEAEQIRDILALSNDVCVRSFVRFRQGTPFPEDPEVLRRAGYVLRIAEALRTSFPTSPSMAGRWIRMGHRRFDNRSPLAVMLQDPDGLIDILAQLDCTFSWEQTSSGAAS